MHRSFKQHKRLDSAAESPDLSKQSVLLRLECPARRCMSCRESPRQALKFDGILGCYLDGVHSRKPLGFSLNQGLQAHGGKAPPQHLSTVAMPLPQVVQPLVSRHSQGLPHAIPVQADTRWIPCSGQHCCSSDWLQATRLLLSAGVSTSPGAASLLGGQ